MRRRGHIIKSQKYHRPSSLSRLSMVFSVTSLRNSKTAVQLLSCFLVAAWTAAAGNEVPVEGLVINNGVWPDFLVAAEILKSTVPEQKCTSIFGEV